MKRTKKRNTRAVTAALLVITACILLYITGFLSQHQERLADSLYGQKPVMTNIVIIGIDDKSLQEIGRWPWQRDNFTKLVQKGRGAQVIGLDIALFEKSNSDQSLAEVNELPVVTVSEYTTFTTKNGKAIGGALLKPVSPINVSSGFANIISDNDGVTRAINLDLGAEESFSAALYEKMTGVRYPKSQRFLINFAGPPNTFKIYSASDVLADTLSDSEKNFSGKIVLIGATARDFHDDAIVPTSSGEPMTGVEIHANALQTMLLGNELQETQPLIAILLMICAGAFVTTLMRRYSPIIAGAGSAVAICTYIGAAIILFDKNIILNIIYVPLTMASTFVILLLLEFLNERATKRRVSDAFGKYVSPHLLERIMNEEVQLGGERREITVMFCDIRGFTATSERISPEELVALLNTHFDRSTEIIHEQQGLVDKFIGDAIMAFWNAPVDDMKHAEHAARSAIEIRDAVNNPLRNDKEGNAGTSPIERFSIGIGLNTGIAIVGNIGSDRRLSYTAIGDSVNLASRLEGLTKEYGVEIIISENTRKLLSPRFTVRELDRVRVKGKKEPVRIYELISDNQRKNENKTNISLYGQALKRYYKGEWTEAMAAFSAINDAPSKRMMKRCEEFAANPPTDWSGVYEMTKK